MVGIDLWLRQHGASEKSFARALRAYFSEQADRIANASENFSGLTPDQVAVIFQPEVEHELLMPIVRRNLGALMIAGAQAELANVEARRGSEKMPDDVDDILRQTIEGIPENVRQRIRVSLDEMSEQPYWRAIQSETETNLTDIIKESIDAGDSPHRMSVRIREQLGGFDARKRAKMIARSETTGSLNAGHQAAMEELSDQGLISGKQWLAILDRRVRETHIDLHNSVVAARADFSVGGSLAPYPGHWSLPAEQRINCRCTTISVLDG